MENILGKQIVTIDNQFSLMPQKSTSWSGYMMFIIMLFQEMVSYFVSIMVSCERGDAYSEAKSITELCAFST